MVASVSGNGEPEFGAPVPPPSHSLLGSGLTPPTRTAPGATARPLKPRHMLMAYMVAAGRSPQQIADALGCHHNTVRAISASPLFKVVVDQVQHEFKDRELFDIVRRLEAEREHTFDRLIDIRDNGGKDDAVPLAAARFLAESDPGWPTAKPAGSDGRIHIHLGDSRLSPLLTSIAEVEGVELPPASADVVSSELEGAAPGKVVPIPVAQLLAELEAAADD